jgi:DNA-binding response OmpR family regulator
MGLRLVIVAEIQVWTRLSLAMEELGHVVAEFSTTRADRAPDGLRDVLLEAHPHDPLVLSPHSETVRRGDRDLRLTSTEYRLPHELAYAPGEGDRRQHGNSPIPHG